MGFEPQIFGIKGWHWYISCHFER